MKENNVTDTANAFRNLEQRIAQLEKAAVDIREETRKAHEATKELRHAIKDAKATRDEIVQILATNGNTLVEEAIRMAVVQGLENYSDTILEAQKRAAKTVEHNFEKILRTHVHKLDNMMMEIANTAARKML